MRPGSEVLWDHQEMAVHALVEKPRFALWWEPGVGKTAPMAVAGLIVGGRQLWVVPAHLRSQTSKEITRFRADGATIQVVTSRADKIGDATVVVVSYELARHVPIWRQLMRIRWASLVVDEAHKLSSTDAVQTHAIYGSRPDSKGALIRAADRVWISTGTPIANHADGLWGHFSRLWPHLATATQEQWLDQYCIREHDLYGVRVVGSKNTAELRSKIRKAGSRLKLTDVHNMPPLIVDTVQVDGGILDLSGFDPTLIKQLEAAIADWDAGDLDWDLEGALAAELKPAVATLRMRLALAKAGFVAEMVRAEIEGGADRVLVFGCHIESLKHIARASGGGLIIGATPTAVRERLVDRHWGGELPVLCGHVISMGTGLNLQRGRRVIFADAAWTPPPNDQAIGRVFRAGQERPVHATFVSLRGSIDERVQSALARRASANRLMLDT